jgi:hypothetical protein
MVCENVKNGVWQVTSPDGIPISSGCANGGGKDCLAKSTVCNLDKVDNNVCCQADYVNTHLYTDQSYNISSFGMFNEGYGYCKWAPPGKQRYCTGNPNMKCSD